ncbi:unnamed protein product [Meganyctiphanes norvegica]|uniref:Uncharacterized protein n=1 Tax=Meganyctiphanes norvegica TaxID=48144 RepID=A0AAV2QGE1_MEGNR
MEMELRALSGPHRSYLFREEKKLVIPPIITYCNLKLFHYHKNLNGLFGNLTFLLECYYTSGSCAYEINKKKLHFPPPPPLIWGCGGGNFEKITFSSRAP